jgi:hypothetical protein
LTFLINNYFDGLFKLCNKFTKNKFSQILNFVDKEIRIEARMLSKKVSLASFFGSLVKHLKLVFNGQTRESFFQLKDADGDFVAVF